MRRLAAPLGLLLLLAGCDGSPLPQALMTVGDLRSVPWPSDVMLGSDGRLAVRRGAPAVGP